VLLDELADAALAGTRRERMARLAAMSFLHHAHVPRCGQRSWRMTSVARSGRAAEWAGGVHPPPARSGAGRPRAYGAQ